MNLKVLLNKIKTGFHPENRKLFTLIVSGLMIGCALLIAMIMVITAPKAKKKPAVRLTPVVEIAELTDTNAPVVIQSAGVIIPVSEVTIQARISGQIIRKNPEFVEGGIIKEGDVLIQIDDRDYQFIAEQKKAALDTAQSELQIEQGRQTIARREWEMMTKQDLHGEGDKDLVTRVPQLNARMAAVASAEADLARSLLNLEYTKLTAPFNALVINADADIGDQASPGITLGRLVCTDAYWVQVPLPASELQWIRIPGSTARITTSTGQSFNGTVSRLQGDLEPQGRMARILVQVDSPLKNTPPLLLNDYVRLHIEGSTLNNICVIPRTALRDGSEVWLIDAAHILHITRAELLWGDRERVFIRKTWESGLRLVTSDLATPVEGMSLRIASEPEPVQSNKLENLKRNGK